MNIRELVGDPLENDLIAFHNNQAQIWTAIPGIIQSFNDSHMTCVVQPAIQAKRFMPDGSVKNISLPLLLDCPVQFPAGGGCTLTFPVVKGDECLVVFSSRCIDAWWQSGGVQPQAELRMHDLSDGFVMLGFRSVPNVISAISTTSAQLRTDDGAAYVGVNSATHEVTINTSAAVTVNAATSATVTAPSIILKNTGAALKNLLNSLFSTWAAGHVHSNGNAGANTGAPTTAPPAGSQTSIVQAE